MEGIVALGIALFFLGLGMYLGAGIGYYDAMRDQDKRNAALNDHLNRL